MSNAAMPKEVPMSNAQAPSGPPSLSARAPPASQVVILSEAVPGAAKDLELRVRPPPAPRAPVPLPLGEKRVEWATARERVRVTGKRPNLVPLTLAPSASTPGTSVPAPPRFPARFHLQLPTPPAIRDPALRASTRSVQDDSALRGAPLVWSLGLGHSLVIGHWSLVIDDSPP